MRVPHDAWWWPSWLVKEAGADAGAQPAAGHADHSRSTTSCCIPLLRRMGFEPTALRRMGWGIAFSGLAWIGAGAIQL